LFVFTLGVLLLGATARAQDFHRTYRVGPGGSISIGNVSGNISVIGYDGDTIVVSALVEGRDRELVQIEDSSGGDRVAIRVRYPDNCNCNANVRFDVQVPRSVSYEFDSIQSVSGDLEVSDVTGSLRAKTVSGGVRVKDVSGTVNAATVSGSVEVEIRRLEGKGDMKFSSVSGSVNVRLPADLDAEVEMSSVSGSLRTDFPIPVEEARYGPGRKARGRVGAGARTVRLSTVSGRVSLSRF
jgi:hypothetical protein